jgi:hypothetical protein
MRWIPPKKADIDPELRKTFQRYGTVTMQMLLATNTTTYRHQGNLTTVERYLNPLLAWLTEQYEWAEVKETWSLTMEAAITVFVAIEVVPLIVKFFRWLC